MFLFYALMIMTRTTIRLDEHLLAEAKSWAIETRRTLSQLIEDTLRETLARHKSVPPSEIELPTYGEGGVMPGVDLFCNATLLDIMEDRPGPV